MRDDQHRHAVAREIAHDVEHLPDHLRVQRRGRLVEQHQLRVHGERPRDRHPLLLPARQVGRVLVGLLGDADPLEQLVRASRAPASAAMPFTFTGASVMLSSTDMCGKRWNCWNTNPISGSQRRQALSGLDRLAVEVDLARVDGLQPVDAAQHRRLAGARRPGDDDHLAARDAQVDAVEDDVVPERLADPHQFDQIPVSHVPLILVRNLHGRTGGGVTP